MGKIKQGILGGFSGKVGTVVGSSWKGVAYMRGKAEHVNNPQTAGQLAQRAKMELAHTYLKPAIPYLNLGLRDVAKNRSPFNYAVSHFVKNAISGDYPDFTIDYSKIILSHGPLIPVVMTKVECYGPNVSFLWKVNSESSNADEYDIIMAFVINKDKAEVYYDMELAYRADMSTQAHLPDSWLNDHIEVYYSMASEDYKLISNSFYLGEFIASEPEEEPEEP